MPIDLESAERRIVLIGVFLCIFLSALDQTIVSTALPRIVQELGGTDLYAWVATSYLLASTVALPVAGRLADMMSPKYILVAAASVFLVGSVLSGLSPSMEALIIFRGLQGLGGGAIMAVAVTVIGLLYPPRERGRIQGVFGAVFGVANVIGPYLGGVLTDDFSWRWVFYVNMPVGLLALYVLLAKMPSLTPSRTGSFDRWGVLTMVLWTVPLLLALSWAGSTYAWTSPVILGLFALTAVAFIAFYRLERGMKTPLFDLSLLKLPAFTWAGFGTLFFGAEVLGSVLFLPFYLVQAKGISPSQSGLALTPLTFGVVLGSMLGGQLASRIGRFKGLLIASNVWSILVFFAVFMVLRTGTPMNELMVLMLLLGVGLGPSFPLYTLAVQNAVRREQMGVATSGNQFMRQIGSAIGAAVMGALLVATLKTQIASHLPAAYRHVSTSSFSSSQLSSPATMRKHIMGQFQALDTRIAAAIEGNPQAYRLLTHDALFPAQYRRLLAPGGIPGQVRHETRTTVTLFGEALRGSATARVAILSNPALPARIKALADHPPASAAARTAVLAGVTKALASQEPVVIRHAEARVLPSVEARVLAAGGRTAQIVIAAVSDGVTAGVRQVFGIAGLLGLVALAAAVLMPGAELRGRRKDEMALAEAHVGAAMDAE